MGFPGGSNGKESATQETKVQSLGQEEPLEELATHSSILACRIPWTEKPGGLQFLGLQRVGHDWATNFHFFFHNVYLSFSSRRMKFNLLFKIPALHFLKRFSLVFGLEKFTAMYSELQWLRIQISGLLKYQVLIPNGVELRVLNYAQIFFILFNWAEYWGYSQRSSVTWKVTDRSVDKDP